MGSDYSKMSCVDLKKQCTLLNPIPYKVYRDNVKTKTPIQIQSYVCGTKRGIIKECCDPFDPAANDLVVGKTNLIKVIRDNDGNYQKFQVCTCNNTQCEKQFCADFKQPTQYQQCRARSAVKTRISPHVYEISASNAFDNCYQMCV